jgi:hypothetical protein
LSKEIVSISLAPSSSDFELTAQIFGEEVHVRRFGTDGDVLRARELVSQYRQRLRQPNRLLLRWVAEQIEGEQ